MAARRTQKSFDKQCRDKSKNLLFVTDDRLKKYDSMFSICLDELSGNVRQELDDKLGEQIKFFKEDIYVKDLEVFYNEVKNLNENGSSILFKSNLVNFALLLCCFSRGCFSSFFSEYYDAQFLDYGKMKIPVELIRSLLLAYDTCLYKDVLAFYSAYLAFFVANFYPGPTDMTDFILEMEPDFEGQELEFARDANYQYTAREGPKYEKFLSSLEVLRKSLVPKVIKRMSNPDFISYLSCNLASEATSARFLPTNIKVSHSGLRLADNIFYDTFDVVIHDFFFHQITKKNCIEKVDCEIMIDFFICIQNEPFANFVFKGLWDWVNELQTNIEGIGTADYAKLFSIAILTSFPIDLLPAEYKDSVFVSPLNQLLSLDGDLNEDQIKSYLSEEEGVKKKDDPKLMLLLYTAWLLQNFEDFPYKEIYMQFLHKQLYPTLLQHLKK